jgi:hypothetical protein
MAEASWQLVERSRDLLAGRGYEGGSVADRPLNVVS